MIKKLISTLVSLILLCGSILFVACNDEQPRATAIEADLSASATKTANLTISANKNPSKIAFNEDLSELNAAFGSSTYDFYTLTLCGIVDLNDIFINSIPTKENGQTWLSSDAPELLSYYTDYFTLKIKVPSDVKTIKIGQTNSVMEQIDANRLIEGYYYLNFKWLNLSANKQTATAYSYPNNNFVLIEFYNSENNKYVSLILKIILDLIFV